MLVLQTRIQVIKRMVGENSLLQIVCCYSKLPQTQNLKTIEIYSFIVWKIRNPKSVLLSQNQSVLRATQIPSGSSRNLFLASSGIWWLLAFPDLQPHQSLPLWSQFLLFCVYLITLSLSPAKLPANGIRSHLDNPGQSAHLKIPSLITSKKNIPFSYKVSQFPEPT